MRGDLHIRATVRGAYKEGILFHTQQQLQILKLAVFFAISNRKNEAFIYSTLEMCIFRVACTVQREERERVHFFKTTIEFTILFCLK